ncbi:DegT/DnrJ/EryC1/StrS family aminotransferase [Nocardioides sp. 616]|uniref:DegT/DnrJ/EryC1/StrS family aminotransferase n=1 Tax=Nocardioides sp. 616 TaxID=2268090 RepID=UPI000CE571F9|nr:DegT/DnrJ/EryC1/StrS family aminotransferase [Nocardioides sp. 616]
MVAFLDLAKINGEVREQMAAAIDEVLSSGWYVLGKQVEQFEAEFAQFVGAKHCVGVGNGLDAICLALRAHGVGPGDEVIVPSNTFIATWLAVTYVGAVPVPVEPDPVTMNIDPARIEAAITSRTRAICPVHLYGLPADLPEINALAQRHGLVVVEDAAQAHGASLDGAPVGSWGNTATWSFYPGKNLGALGDGGAITTDDAEVAEKLRSLRNYGSSAKYVHELRGVNSRLDEMQAAVLRVKLSKLSEWNTRRGQIAQRYLEGLEGTGLTLPSVTDGVHSAWHLFVIRTERREELRGELDARGIQTLIHYPTSPHMQGAYADDFSPGEFPIAEHMQDRVLSLPMGPHLSLEDADDVVAAIRELTSRMEAEPPR